MAVEARRGGVRAARAVLVAALLGAAAAALAQAGAAVPVAPPTPAADMMVAACEACHGPGGNAIDPAVPSIAGQPRVFIENQLVLIREGLREVPSMTAVMGALSDEHIRALARHRRPAGGAAADHRPAGRAAARGGDLAPGAVRHLPPGRLHTGQDQVPRLAGQNEAYLRYSLTQFRDHPGPGRDTIMAATLAGMTDADLAALAHYLASSRP